MLQYAPQCRWKPMGRHTLRGQATQIPPGPAQIPPNTDRFHQQQPRFHQEGPDSTNAQIICPHGMHSTCERATNLSPCRSHGTMKPRFPTPEEVARIDLLTAKYLGPKRTRTTKNLDVFRLFLFWAHGGPDNGPLSLRQAASRIITGRDPTTGKDTLLDHKVAMRWCSRLMTAELAEDGTPWIGDFFPPSGAPPKKKFRASLAFVELREQLGRDPTPTELATKISSTRYYASCLIKEIKTASSPKKPL